MMASQVQTGAGSGGSAILFQPAVARAAMLLLGVALLAAAPAVVCAAGPQVIAFSAAGGTADLDVATTPGAFYLLQGNDRLDTRYWVDRSALVVAPGATLAFSDTEGASSRFWRVCEFSDSVFWYDWQYLSQAQYLAPWGLGGTQESYEHVDRAYEWYIDQADTGVASDSNCGPSSVTMALRWRNEAFAKTAAEAREWSSSWRGVGWWYTSDIINYLTLQGVDGRISQFTGADQLAGLIAEGNLLILCIDTTYLAQNFVEASRTGRFYGFGGGHFLVVKGARTVSGVQYLEVYDPNTWHQAYGDGTPKGRNRHYRAGDLNAAITNWWPYLIVVPPAAATAGIPGIRARSFQSWERPVDPASIEHACGR